jgi:arylsulfatase A
VGKWHLGHQKKFLPTSQGFDYYYGIPFSNDMWLPAGMAYAADAKLPADLDAEKRKTGERNRSVVPLMRNEEVIEYPADQPELTERYTAEVVKFITANNDRPFFVYLPHTMPHYPLHVSKRFAGKSKGGKFGDVIECIDWGVGEILAALKKLGIDERTLVIYTSDNGPAAGSAGPLRGKKGSTWEGGMREPCIMRWPGKIPAGSVCSELATIMDLLPTLAGLAGAKPPTDRVIDGKDIWPLLSSKPGAKSPHEAFFYHTAQGQLAGVRVGKWKFHLKPPGPRRKRGEPRPPTPAPQLYDLSSDIGEKTDVAAENPDVVKRLKEVLEKFDAELKANSRPVGRA